MHEINGRKFRKVAKGATDAAAQSALAATLAITSGIVDRVTVTQEDLLAGYPPNASNSYSDANFQFRDGTREYNVHFEQLSNDYAEVNLDGDTTGYVDLSGPVVAWAAAAHPGDTLVSGKYVK
jgi:hypothetical protein